ncbi:MAG: hypothetical protein H6636_01035, partial [Anaerolineales bacterium]|nr:hypothetical protein [Anaerolineales bacterium]
MKRLFAFISSTVLTLMIFIMIGCNTTNSTPASSATPTPEDNPTAGAIIRATRIVQATQSAKATANAQATLNASATQLAFQATQTQQANLYATATVVAQATREALLNEQAGWPNLLLDSFEDNHLDWPLGVTEDHSLSVESQIRAQHYQWTVNVFNGNSYFNLIPTQSPVLADFYAAVTVQLTDGHEYGLAAYGLTFRHVEDDYGFFGITGNGLFRILEVHGTGIYQLLISDSPFIDQRPGATNRIGVIAVGPDFVFLINDRVVGQMNADIAPGQIGLGV